jgi:hypothetical protein
MEMKMNLVFLLALCSSSAWSFSVPASKAARPTFALNSVMPFNVANKGGLQRIEGQTRKTWTFGDTSQEDIEVFMTSSGRPIEANVDLWIGPDWTPYNLKAYSEDGNLRPIQTLVGTRNKIATVEIKNTAPMEFPLNAGCNYAVPPLSDVRTKMPETTDGNYIEGGAIWSLPIKAGMEQVAVLIETDSRQLNAVIEILSGPNNPKQSYKIFTNNGLLNSLYVVFNSVGGEGNTIRIKNIAPVEFPCRVFISTEQI